MKTPQAITGYFRNGLPYNRVGFGPRTLVIIQGLVFENRPLSARWAPLYSRYYQYLANDFTTYIVVRKPGLPPGYSMQNMADDYAVMIREELGGPVDVWGISTGGSLAQQFAADHPDLVLKLVIQASAYTLSDYTKRVQMDIAHLARQRRWGAAYAALANATLANSGAWKEIAKPAVWAGSRLAALASVPKDPSDLVVTIEAEDKFNLKDRLKRITAPTLVVAGDNDPFYPEVLFRETAAGIPNARLILYQGMGHPAGGKQFRRDVLAFLREG